MPAQGRGTEPDDTPATDGYARCQISAGERATGAVPLEDEGNLQLIRCPSSACEGFLLFTSPRHTVVRTR